MHFVPQAGAAKNRDAVKIKIARKWTWALFRAVLLLGIGFIILYPLLFMLSMSFKTYHDIVNPAVVWIPRNWTLQNYKNAFDFMDFKKAFANSLSLGVGASVLQTFSCALIGYGFARFRFFGRDFLFGAVILTLLVPPATIVIPQFLQLRFFDLLGLFNLLRIPSINLINTHFALYLPAALGMGLRSGIFIYMFRQYFRGQPKELDDAARVDGCGYFGIFARIMSPNAASIYLTVLLFSIVWNWNDYYSVSMFTDQLGTLPLSLALMRDMLRQASYVASRGITNDPYTQAACLMSGCFLTIAPVLALYVILQRYFVESIERSGIVG